MNRKRAYFNRYSSVSFNRELDYIIQTRYQFISKFSLHLDMLKNGSNKGITFESTSNLLKILFLLLTVTICAKSGHCREREFLLSICIDHIVESYDSIHPFIYNMNNIFCRSIRCIKFIVFQHHLVCPSPFISIVVGMHNRKTIMNLIHISQLSTFNVIHQSLNLTLWGYKTRYIYPFTFSNLSIRLKSLSY